MCTHIVMQKNCVLGLSETRDLQYRRMMDNGVISLLPLPLLEGLRLRVARSRLSLSVL